MIMNATGQLGTEDRIVLIWENPNPTSQFEPQTVKITDHIVSRSSASEFYIVALSKITDGVISTSVVLNHMPDLTQKIVVSDSTSLYTRSVTINYNEFVFTSGYCDVFDSNTPIQGGPGNAIPLRIYAVR